MSDPPFASSKLFRLGTLVQSALIRGGPKAQSEADENVRNISLLVPWHGSCSVIANDELAKRLQNKIIPGEMDESRGSPCIR
jgi:hypothetical protein